MLPSCTIRLADDNVTGPDGKKMLEDNVSRSSTVTLTLTLTLPLPLPLTR